MCKCFNFISFAIERNFRYYSRLAAGIRLTKNCYLIWTYSPLSRAHEHFVRSHSLKLIFDFDGIILSKINWNFPPTTSHSTKSIPVRKMCSLSSHRASTLQFDRKMSTGISPSFSIQCREPPTPLNAHAISHFNVIIASIYRKQEREREEKIHRFRVSCKLWTWTFALSFLAVVEPT